MGLGKDLNDGEIPHGAHRGEEADVHRAPRFTGARFTGARVFSRPFQMRKQGALGTLSFDPLSLKPSTSEAGTSQGYADEGAQQWVNGRLARMDTK